MNKYTGPIVDIDIHHRPKNSSELAAYLPKLWQDNIRGNLSSIPDLAPPAAPFITVSDGRRADTVTEPGVASGYDFELLKESLLDHHDYYKAVLTHDVGEWPAHANHYFVRDLCRAANDWTIDHWLSKDDRLNMVLIVPTGEPDEAAAEIRRIGHHPRCVGVLFAANQLGRPVGDPIYHPIYEAAVETGLQIAIHVGIDRPNRLTTSVGGPPGTHAEAGSQCTQQAMHYVSSLIVHGVFEKYPDLHVMIKEYGVAWLPPFLWRLDQEYELLRLESPWVKKWPSEYVRAHIKLSTQPIEDSPRRGGTVEFLELFDGIEELLCFSTDYPHQSMDYPEYIARLLPAAWHRKVFCDNACSVYGWELPPY